MTHPNIEEYIRKVKCDGDILILTSGGGIIKKKYRTNLTVDLKYIESDNIFIDSSNVVYLINGTDKQKEKNLCQL